jgi:hypothetical protein
MRKSLATDPRVAAIELSARFAKIGEEPAISVARAEMIYDFIACCSQFAPTNPRSELEPSYFQKAPSLFAEQLRVVGFRRS